MPKRWQICIKQQWQSIVLAIGFFTRIPVPSQLHFYNAQLNHASTYFPLVGLLVGMIATAVFLLADNLLPHNIAVLLSMASTLLLTGAFHEDGLADSVDALGGGWERERILTIMQDSRIGSFGSIALLMALLLKFELLSALKQSLVPIALIVGHSLSRLSALWVMTSLPYAKPGGKAKPLATHISGRQLYLANCLGLSAWLFFAGLLWMNQNLNSALFWLSATILPLLLVWAWWRHKLGTWLQGYTGDTLGATQQLCEVAFYIGVLAWSLHCT